MKAIALVVGLAALLVANGARAKPQCSVPQIQEARHRAQRAFNEKRYPAAVETLQALEKQCDLPRGTTESVWAENDLAWAHYKAGDPIACLQLIGHWVLHDAHEITDERLQQALEHNQEACAKAREKRFAGFTARPCSIAKPDGAAEKFFAAPASWNQEGVEAQCVAAATCAPG